MFGLALESLKDDIPTPNWIAALDLAVHPTHLIAAAATLREGRCPPQPGVIGPQVCAIVARMEADVSGEAAGRMTVAEFRAWQASQRVSSADMEAVLAILAKVPDVPPEPGDEMPLGADDPGFVGPASRG